MKKTIILMALIFSFGLTGNAYSDCSVLWKILGNTVIDKRHYEECFFDEWTRLKEQDVNFSLKIESGQWIGGSACPTEGKARLEYIFILEDYWGEYPREFSELCEFDGVDGDIPYFTFFVLSEDGKRITPNEPCYKLCCPYEKGCYECPDGPPKFFKFKEGIEDE